MTAMLMTRPDKTALLKRLVYSGPARALSLLLALALSLIVLVMPNWVSSTTAELDHGMLSLMFWGVSAGFVHGMGYIPVTRLWRWLLGPWVAWVAMIWGVTSWSF